MIKAYFLVTSSEVWRARDLGQIWRNLRFLGATFFPLLFPFYQKKGPPYIASCWSLILPLHFWRQPPSWPLSFTYSLLKRRTVFLFTSFHEENSDSWIKVQHHAYTLDRRWKGNDYLVRSNWFSGCDHLDRDQDKHKVVLAKRRVSLFFFAFYF